MSAPAQMGAPLLDQITQIGLSERRTAAWLHSPYLDPVWQVTDTDDASESLVIDFRYRMAAA